LIFDPFGPLDGARIKDGQQRMTNPEMPSQFDANENGGTLRRRAGTGMGDVAGIQITVTPPLRSDGVARMLVALGDAGIGVSQVVPTNDDYGMYCITVNASSALASKVLVEIGCVVNCIQSGAYSYSDQTRQEQGSSPYGDYR
jgi:hypothetical protein